MNRQTNVEIDASNLAKISGVLVLMLGAVVLFGWHTANNALVQVHPSFAPMQYNTALAFLLCGVGLTGLASGIRIVSTVCGALVFSIGAATLSRYIFGIDLGIDQATMEHNITVQTSHPGRMAPNTALCFILSGAMLGINRSSVRTRRIFIATRALIVIMFALSVVAFLGYVSQVETAYGWSNLTRMALHTSLGFIILSLGILATTFRSGKVLSELKNTTGWLAVCGVAVTMMIAVSLSFEFEKNETKLIRADLNQEALFIRNTLERALGSRFLDLRRVAQQQAFLRNAPAPERLREARKYLRDGEDLIAVGFADLSLKPQWIDTLRDDVSPTVIEASVAQLRPSLNFKILFHNDAGEIEPLAAMDDEGRFLSFLPIVRDSAVEGFIIGVFDLDVLVTSELSKDYFNRHGIALTRNGELVFGAASQDWKNADRWGVTNRLEFYGISWKVKVWPKDQYLVDTLSPLRQMVIGVGILCSGLLLLLYRHSEAERRRVDERMREAAFLEAVLDNVNDGIVACDSAGALTLFNRAAKDFHGVDADASKADEWAAGYDLYASDGSELLATNDIPLMKGFKGERVEGQEMVIAPDGLPRRSVLANAAPLISPDGEKLGAVATMKDVTAERAATEAARRREQELQLIFDNVPVRLWLKDDKNVIVRLNEPAAQSMGVSVEAAEGADTYDLFPEQAKKYHDDDLEVINSGAPKIGIVEEYTPSAGARGWVRTDKVPYVDEKTGERMVFVASVDITKQVEASKELQRSNAALEQFARVASHDLQEPLRKLMIFSGFLEEDLGKDIPEKAKADLQAISSSADRMRNLVRDMLSLSRIRADGITPRPVDPQECVTQAMAALSQQCRDLRAVIKYDALPPVMAESTLLTQVYQNLAGNALKFTAPGCVPTVKFGAERSGNDVILSVEDNGIGIKDKDRKMIFEPLTRLHSRDAFEGTGIGLAICKKTIETFGGEIWVENAPTGGACFKFRLKSAEAIESAA